MEKKALRLFIRFIKEEGVFPYIPKVLTLNIINEFFERAYDKRLEGINVLKCMATYLTCLSIENDDDSYCDAHFYFLMTDIRKNNRFALFFRNAMIPQIIAFFKNDDAMRKEFEECLTIGKAIYRHKDKKKNMKDYIEKYVTDPLLYPNFFIFAFTWSTVSSNTNWGEMSHRLDNALFTA